MVASMPYSESASMHKHSTPVRSGCPPSPEARRLHLLSNAALVGWESISMLKCYNIIDEKTLRRGQARPLSRRADGALEQSGAAQKSRRAGELTRLALPEGGEARIRSVAAERSGRDAAGRERGQRRIVLGDPFQRYLDGAGDVDTGALGGRGRTGSSPAP